MSKAVKWLLGVVVVAVLAVIAFFTFGNKGGTTETKQVTKLPEAYDNKNKAIEGGDLKVAAVSDTPFQGSYLAPLQGDALTSSIFGPTGSGIFKTDKSFQIVKGGAADVKLDTDKKTATITLRDDLKWSDGQPVTAKDYEFTYEMIANDAYGSDRWTASLTNIEGMSEFHKGTAKSISGITYPDGEDGKKVVVQFKELTPGMKYSGNGYFLESVVPYHQLKDIAPADVMGSEANTTTPLTWGPFKVDNVVSGESVRMVPNPYWYGSKPKLSSITTEVVATTKIVAALKAHKYDTTVQASPTLYQQVKKVAGYKITGNESTYVSLKYFNLGHYDEEKGENVTDRKTPLQDKRVRQALGYAMNTDDVIKKFAGGLGERATTIVPPIFSVHDKSLKGFNHDSEKAEKLLDEAGWKLDKDSGYRKKDGKTLSLIYLARQGDATSQSQAQNFIQEWKKVGVKVSLYNNKLVDFNTWSKMMTEGTSQKWDITDGAWSMSSEPSQQDLFSKEAPYNFGHFTSKKLTSLLNSIDSQKAMDSSYRQKQFDKYQEYVNDEAFVLPFKYQLDYAPVNKRVVGWTNSFAAYDIWAKIGVDSNSLATK